MRKIISLIMLGIMLSSGSFSQSWEVYNSSNSSIPFNSICGLSIDSRGWVWIANENSGDCPHVGWYDGSAWNSYLTTDKVSDVTSDSKGDVYFSTSAREILRYHFGAWFTQGSVFLSSAYINPIFCDKNNTLWMGKSSSYYAIIKYDGKNWSEFSSLNSGFPPSTVECFQDVGTNLWIGTSTHGLVKLTDTVFTIYDPNNSDLPASKISAIAAKNDTLFFFCDEKLMSYKNTFKVISTFPDEIEVSDMAIDSKGNFWFSSDRGLIKYNRKSWKIYDSLNSPLADVELTSIVIDKSNTIWLGSKDNGLIRFNEAKVSAIADHYSNLNVTCYPNPLDAKLIINYNMPAAGNVTIDFTDLQGKNILSQNPGISVQGNNTISLNLPELSAGIYLLKISTPYGSEVVKLKK